MKTSKIFALLLCLSLMSVPSQEIIAVPTDLVEAGGSDGSWLSWAGGAVALGVGGYFLKKAYDYFTGWTPNQVLVTLSWNEHTKVVNVKTELLTKSLLSDLEKKSEKDIWDIAPEDINPEQDSPQPVKQLRSGWHTEPLRAGIYEDIRDRDLYRAEKQLRPVLGVKSIKPPGSYFLINPKKKHTEKTSIPSYVKTDKSFKKAYDEIVHYLVAHHNNRYVFQFLIPIDVYTDVMQEKGLIYLNFSNIDGLTTSFFPITWVSPEEKASGLLGDKRHKVRIDLEYLKKGALDAYDKLIVPYLTEFSVRLYNPSDKLDSSASYVQTIPDLEKTIEIITRFLKVRNNVDKDYAIEFGVARPLYELWKMKQK